MNKAEPSFVLVMDDEIKYKISKIMKWVGFYRKNIDQFIKDYLGIHLTLSQRILITEIDANMYSMFLAARALGKTYLVSAYCCARCILYPGTQIIVASGVRDQANLVLNKIMSEEIYGASPNLAKEIKESKVTAHEGKIVFYNGSSIKVVASGDSARGYRANILIVDEFRLIEKDVIDLVLQPIKAVPRHPGFLNNPKYENYPKESNKEIYMSSAWYKTHWSYEFFMQYVKNFIEGTDYFVCALPFQLSIKEGIGDVKDLKNKYKESGRSPHWKMERECIFLGADDEAFFQFEDLNKIRTLEIPIYTSEIYNVINDKKIKYSLKKPGEIRVLTADIALMGGKKNDNSSVYLIQLEPFGKEGFKRYKRNVPYGEVFNGLLTQIQALKIRRLFDDFECDYLVLDTRNNGEGVYDELVCDIFDKERIITYPAITCFNREDMALRCKVFGAKRVIYAVKANEEFNSQCALILQNDILQGNLRLLINSEDGERLLNSFKWYNDLDSYYQAKLAAPYYETNMLIDEMVNLEREVNKSTIKLKEQSSRRKDRYSSLSYGNYFVKTLERNLVQSNSDESSKFYFRAPLNILGGR